jgi:hypothetical protein
MICPVPIEQQPINEYEQLKDSWFFSWATLTLPKYVKKLVLLALIGLIGASPIAAYSFPITKKPLLFTLASGLGGFFILAIVLVQLYLGWRYVCDRLQQDVIFYEESGWYDGQSWAKTKEILERDRLVVSYQVKPILNRLKQTILVLLGLVSTDFVLWYLQF